MVKKIPALHGNLSPIKLFDGRTTAAVHLSTKAATVEVAAIIIIIIII